MKVTYRVVLMEAFTSMMRTTADEITALKATVCREWQMSRHVPDFGAF
jgi:hypothetical protein